MMKGGGGGGGSGSGGGGVGGCDVGRRPTRHGGGGGRGGVLHDIVTNGFHTIHQRFSLKLAHYGKKGRSSYIVYGVFRCDKAPL